MTILAYTPLMFAPASGGCWPTPQQELLLRAVLLRGAPAVEAWERWRGAANIDRLDAGSLRLLPLLHRALQREGIADPLQAQLRDAYRHTWSQNQLRFRDLKRVLEVLARVGIPVALLKGAALIVEYYRDLGLRPMDDLDVLVSARDATLAVAALRGSGWTPNDVLSEKRLRTLHAMGFHDATGRKVDLHWRVLQDARGSEADDDLWRGVRPANSADLAAGVLHPADQLLHVCAHGIRWNRIPPIRWVADASAILTDSNDEMDWDRLVRATERHRLTLPIRAALRYLRTFLGARIDAGALDRLERIPLSRSQRLEYRFRIAPAPRPVLGYIPEYWFDWLRSSSELSWPRRLSGFPGYLQDRFESDGLWQLMRKLLQKWGRRIHATIERRKRPRTHLR